MNKKEYNRAINDTRKAIYKGNIGQAALGVLRALIAKNDPDVVVTPRRLQQQAPKRIGAGKSRRK